MRPSALVPRPRFEELLRLLRGSSNGPPNKLIARLRFWPKSCFERIDPWKSFWLVVRGLPRTNDSVRCRFTRAPSATSGATFHPPSVTAVFVRWNVIRPASWVRSIRTVVTLRSKAGPRTRS